MLITEKSLLHYVNQQRVFFIIFSELMFVWRESTQIMWARCCNKKNGGSILLNHSNDLTIKFNVRPNDNLLHRFWLTKNWYRVIKWITSLIQKCITKCNALFNVRFTTISWINWLWVQRVECNDFINDAQLTILYKPARGWIEVFLAPSKIFCQGKKTEPHWTSIHTI